MMELGRSAPANFFKGYWSHSGKLILIRARIGWTMPTGGKNMPASTAALSSCYRGSVTVLPTRYWILIWTLGSTPGRRACVRAASKAQTSPGRELSSKCLNVEATNGLSYYDPSVVELRKQAAISYFNCVCQTSKEVTEEDFLTQHKFSPPVSQLKVIPEMENASFRFQQRFVLSLSDESYEVRIATLKWLLLFLKAMESGMEASE
ncbi:hypothetical protein RHGRI_028421 [Rhododendron griersonianum]|uniref:Uncharacterized protein n=1 Tax=Rhododendron griersonianum TaxID=479676 RepID=A0AAV6IG64_9ERIC|nr:hypothetical protein RHGRI_028421 [Rhododendron griersonianum]